uniref:Uncharacterized protein n=1 Tax=Anguilla anguilla TaxID=7936 RepID=A0A0E9PLA3_ANGAN
MLFVECCLQYYFGQATMILFFTMIRMLQDMFHTRTLW